MRELAAVLLIFLLLAFVGSFRIEKVGYERVELRNISIGRCGILRLVGKSGEIEMVVSRSQAYALKDVIEGVKHQRPSTHDIAVVLAKMVGARGLKIEKLINGTYYAKLETEKGSIDIRPSDGLIICYALKCPVYAKRDLLK